MIRLALLVAALALALALTACGWTSTHRYAVEDRGCVVCLDGDKPPLDLVTARCIGHLARDDAGRWVCTDDDGYERVCVVRGCAP